jgi:hypothetical protein
MVGECLRNNTTLMLPFYLSLSIQLCFVAIGAGEQNWGVWVTVVPPVQRWSPSLLKTPASCRAQRVLSRSPCKSPTEFPIPPPIKSYNSERERSRKRRRKRKKMCVFLCVGFFLTGNDSSVGSRDNGGWFFFSVLVQDGLFSIKRKSAHDATTTTNLFSPTLLAYRLNPKLLLLNSIPTTTKRRRRRRTRTRGSCRTRTKSR